MTQLIINGLYLPETSHDKYQCPEVLLAEQVEMISGRMVQEVRGGKVYRPSYQYDYLTDSVWRALKETLVSGKSFPAVVLPDHSDSMVSGTYLVESFTPPTFAFSKSGKAYWHNIAFVLREVNPHA